MINATSAFYLRGKGAEDQVIEPQKCHGGLRREAKVKISSALYCLLCNPVAYFWLWQHCDRGEGELGLTQMQLELVGPPVNYQPYVPQDL